MALYLTEADVRELLPMDRAIECVEESFRAWARGGALNRPRQRIFLPGLSLHYMAAAWQEENLIGVKIYTVSRSGFRFLVLLYDAGSGEWLALIEADHLGRIRTGAASGVATKWLARAEASRVGVVGSGRQARTQLEAVAKVRKVIEVKVYSRDPARRAESDSGRTAIAPSHDSIEKRGSGSRTAGGPGKKPAPVRRPRGVHAAGPSG